MFSQFFLIRFLVVNEIFSNLELKKKFKQQLLLLYFLSLFFFFFKSFYFKFFFFENVKMKQFSANINVNFYYNFSTFYYRILTYNKIKFSKFSFLRSPFIYKSSWEQFELRKRLIFFYFQLIFKEFLFNTSFLVFFFYLHHTLLQKNFSSGVMFPFLFFFISKKK